MKFLKILILIGLLINLSKMISFARSSSLFKKRTQSYHNLIRGPHESVCINSIIEFNLLCIDIFSPETAIIYSTIGLRLFLGTIRYHLHN